MKTRASNSMLVLTLLAALAFAAQSAKALDPRAPLNHFAHQSWRTENGLPQNSVHAILQTRDGFLWLATEAGLARFDGYNFKNFDKESSPALPNNDIRCLLEDHNGALWIGTANGLVRWDHGNTTTFTTANGLPADTIEALHESSDGTLQVTTAAGIARASGAGNFTPASESPVQKSKFSQTNGLPGTRVQTTFTDREGATWIGTNGGLARFFDGTVTALPGNSILTIYEDREGNLWTGTESDGLNVLRDQKFTMFGTHEGLSSDATSAILQTADKSIWVGTSGAGLNRINANRVTTYTTKDGLASDIILALAADKEENLWIGTPDGLTRFSHGNFTTYTSADGMADDFVRSLLVDPDNSLWIGTRRGLSHLQNGAFTTVTQSAGLGSNLIGAMLQDRNGTLWIATLGGLSSIRTGHIENFTTRDGLSSNVITALHQDATGTLWIGTNGEGLCRRNEKEFSCVARDSGLPHLIYSMLEDDAGNLWLTSDQGIYRVSLTELRAYETGSSKKLLIAVYGTADGLATREAAGTGRPAAYRTGDGQLWFATLKGVATIDPQQIPENRVPPPVVIERITVDDQAVSQNAIADVAPGHTHFTFEYAALSFVAPQKVTYRYKLEGFDRDWTDAGPRRIAYYTNIPPGHYRFRVIAANNDGIWNEDGAAVAFRLRPHFYQTIWFALACIGLLALIIFLLYQARVRRIRQQFEAVSAERNRLAREIHDTLAQDFVAVSVKLELMSQLIATSAIDSAKEQLDDTRALVREGLADARRSIWDLRSEGKDGDTLPGRLKQTVTQTIRQSAATPAVTPHFQVSGTFMPLAPSIENELLRIAQEAVTNVVRHSHAKNVTVRLLYDPNQVVLEIADDGRGFHQATARSHMQGHFGLTGMQERAQQLGGKIEIESAPEKGTLVRVEAPTSNSAMRQGKSDGR